MTIEAFLDDLRRRGIALSVDGDRLRCVAPKGTLTPDLQRQLAARKAELLATLTAPPPLLPLERVSRDGVLPLSFAQDRLWFLNQLEPESPAYNILASIRFERDLDVAALERALTEVVRRQEALRTTFPAVDGEPRAQIHPPSPVALTTVDLRALTTLERDEEIRRLKQQGAAHVFDLHGGPLFECTLLRIGASLWELLITQHHIITDRWSLGLLLNEIQEQYAAAAEGRSAARPDLDRQYVDYAAWQRATFEQQRDHIAYWRTRLAAPLPILELSTDRPRPPLQTSNGAWETRTMPFALGTLLRGVSTAEGATLFMTLLAAYKALLSRHTGVVDVLIGTPVAGRHREELEPIIGCFINTVVLRTDLSGNPTFREIVRRVRDTALDAFGRQDVPFERIIAELQLPRDLSRPPVFQTVFVMQNAPKSVEVTSDMTFSASGGTMFDVLLTAVEVGDGLQVTAEYNTDLFDRPTVTRLLAQYETLLVAVARNPDLHLGEVPILSQADIADLPQFVAGAASDRRQALITPALIAEQAARRPDAVAVGQGADVLTYAALRRSSAAIAARLRDAGIRRGDRVGVCVDRTPSMIAALLGVWESQAAYLPLDPAFPPDRLEYMVRDAAVRVVITDQASRDAVPAGVETVLCLDTLDVSTASPDGPAVFSSPDDVAYVIYTSGSTGWPKGVVVPHRAVANFLVSMATAPGLDATDVLLAVTTLSFDIAGLELLLPLTVGARVEMARRDEVADGMALAARLADSGATVLQATPATWRLLLEAGWNNPSGARMFCGGEALPRELADRLMATGGSLWNLYGPTETTIWSTVDPVGSGGDAVPIGRPIANTFVYVLDAAGQAVPAGVVGELYIGGEGVADGYHHRPALTAEKFVPDPFSGVPGARMYRTGDVARWQRDGRLVCLGRIDHQVKVRGFRIELGEIETGLAALDSVQQAVVTAQPDLSGEHRLVAYVVPRTGQSVTASDLRTALRRSLPDYMVPSVFVMLEALPLTANLKVDRRALPAVFASAPAADRHVEPVTTAERAIADIWQAVLEIPRVSADANFFDVGGHSLLAMRALARIEQRFGLHLGPRVLMLDTLAQIAARCERHMLAATGGDRGADIHPTLAPA